MIFGLVVLSFAGCRNKNLVRPGDSVSVAFEKGQKLYDKGAYGDAAEAFETVTRQGRETDLAAEAQYLLAESYYKRGLFLLSASEYERFILFYPQDDRTTEIEFKQALSYYKQSPRYKLDQSTTRKAIELFQLFNSKHPDSEFVTESANKIDELRSKLAQKNYEAASFYYRIESYEAASIYFNLTIDQYPESEWAELALVKQIHVFVDYASNSIEEKQRERYTKAVEAYEKFLQLFPESSMREEAEIYKDMADKGLSNLSESSELLGEAGNTGDR